MIINTITVGKSPILVRNIHRWGFQKNRWFSCRKSRELALKKNTMKENL